MPPRSVIDSANIYFSICYMLPRTRIYPLAATRAPPSPVMFPPASWIFWTSDYRYRRICACMSSSERSPNLSVLFCISSMIAAIWLDSILWRDKERVSISDGENDSLSLLYSLFHFLTQSSPFSKHPPLSLRLLSSTHSLSWRRCSGVIFSSIFWRIASRSARFSFPGGSALSPASICTSTVTLSSSPVTSSLVRRLDSVTSVVELGSCSSWGRNDNNSSC